MDYKHFTDNMQLTAHFKFSELAGTSREELKQANWCYALTLYPALLDLAVLLEKARKFLGVPLVITSGARCPELNKAAGGSANSQHLKGEAADFVPKGMSCLEAFDILSKSDLHFGQLEYGNNSGREWLHISLGAPYRDISKCRQLLKIIDGERVV